MKHPLIYIGLCILIGLLFLRGSAVPAKGNKVPFINPDGSRQPAERNRDAERESEDRLRRRQEALRAESSSEKPQSAPKPASEPDSPDGIAVHPSSSENELRFTVTAPQRVYEAGEYRPNRPDRWNGRAGKTEFQLERMRRGGDELTTVTVKCPVPGWQKAWTPLHSAAAAGDLDGITRELEKGISVDVSADFMTPLHISAVMGEEDAARLLLRSGADLTAKTFEGKTSPELAALCHHPELARLLTVFTTARQLTDGGKTVTVSLDSGRRTDLTAELKRIASGRRDEHRHDGSVFGNYERKLPAQNRYYYTEFVHRTNPNTPGPRRVVIGMKGDVWYTPDHYNTFFRVAP